MHKPRISIRGVKSITMATPTNLCLCTSKCHLEISDGDSIMKNIVSQLYNVAFQNHSEHSTAVLPLLFTHLSYLLPPGLIYGPVSLLRGFQRFNFHSPDRVILWEQANEHH